mgnify:CR=1 FL=1
MELAAMALILTAVLVGQYFIYKRFGLKDLSYTPVSYTHLTLPTSDLV